MNKMKKPKYDRKKLWFFSLVVILLMTLALPATAFLTYQIYYYHKIFPVMVASTDLTGKNLNQAQSLLSDKADSYTKTSLIITNHSQTWEWPLNQLNLVYETKTLANQAYLVGREGSLIDRLKVQTQIINEPRELPVQVSFNQDIVNDWIASIAAEINVPMVPPTIIIDNQNPSQKDKVKIQPGQDGSEVDTVTLKQLIVAEIASWNSDPIPLPISYLKANNDEASFNQAKTTAQAFLGKSLNLKVDDLYVNNTWQINDEAMIGFIDIGNGFDQTKIRQYLTGVADTINRKPDDARFKFNEQTGKVEEFIPAKDGLVLNIDESTYLINQSLNAISQGEVKDEIKLLVNHTKPSVTLENANTLGIKELIGRGTSTFKGSIPTRVHNVALAASRITGTLIKPGETFSFNEAVGDVSGETGYQQAYIIRNGRTELGDGGGVCQDSTTVFRAALNAGLPITERHAHAYRVGYYEQDTKAGIDATVYAPSPDLKFTNDTPAYILIQATADTQKRTLVVDIYGTSDGRQATISNHVVWDVTPPPPDVYIDDPTMANSQVKQVDWKAGGAKAKFDYTVKRNGESIFQKTFYSTYKPWAAVFLRGTGQ
jgi:vancomycin resistance protein YoaR